MARKVSRGLELSAGARTQPGRERAINEDSLGLPSDVAETRLARKGYLYIVADGMGGHQKGGVASQMAVEAIRRAYYQDPNADPTASLGRAVEMANAEIHRQARDPAYAGMGATVVAAVVQDDQLIVANVGDSRAYLARWGRLEGLTSDHTWVAERVQAGILTSAEATGHDMRHVITRSLGGEPSVEVDVRSHRLRPGDRLLLCSDGLWEPISEREMARLLVHRGPQAAANALVNRAAAAGGADDATAMVVAVQAVPSGVLGKVEGAVGRVLASPQQRLAVGGIGAVLLLAMLAWGVARTLRIQKPAQIAPVVTASRAVAISPSHTAEGAPVLLTSPASPSPSATIASPTPTPTSPPQPTSTPLPSPVPATEEAPQSSGGTEYCVAPSWNPQAPPDFPANAVDPNTCERIGLSLGVGEHIWVPNENVHRDCKNNKIIQVAYKDGRYWIYAHRVGRRSGGGACQPVANWRDFFARPRQ